MKGHFLLQFSFRGQDCSRERDARLHYKRSYHSFGKLTPTEFLERYN